MFLKRFIAKCNGFSEDNLEKVVSKQSKLIYAAYTVLVEHDFKESDICAVNCDDDSVMIKLASKDLAKQVKERCHREEVRVGVYYYKLKVKVKDQYVYISAIQDRRVDDNIED